MQKAEDASVVWLNSDVQIASFHYEDGYKQLNFSNQVFFMSFLQIQPSVPQISKSPSSHLGRKNS